MRLLSITVRAYRLHKDLTVELDPARTLIGGPNESGKSTLIEAAHRALFLKARVTGEAQKSMVSDLHAGHPEVEVRFESGGAVFRLQKRFSGASGTATLTREGGSSWSQDEAETRLAELLGVEPTGGGRGVAERAAAQWSHLWVRQGEAGADPSDHATSHRDSLLARLQDEGAAGAMESALDRRVAAHFEEQLDSLFTSGGKIRAHSELDRSEKALERARAGVAKAEADLDRLQQAAAEFTAAEQTIREQGSELDTLSARQREVAAKRAEAAELRQSVELAGRDFDDVRRRHEELAAADREIASLSADIRTRKESLAPMEAEAGKLESRQTQARERLGTAIVDIDQVARGLRTVRRRLDLAGAWARQRASAAHLAELEAASAEVAALREAVASLESDRAGLPLIDEPRLRALRDLQARRAEARAALEAMATGITVVASDVPVAAGEDALPPGEPRIITEETEITIGDSTRLRISPGGGTSLAEARRNVHALDHEYTAALDTLGIASVDEAAESLARRQQIEGRIRNLQAELKGKRADDIDTRLAEARTALTAATAEVDRRTASMDDDLPPAPGDTDAARSLESECQAALDRLESRQNEIRTETEAAREAAETAETALTRQRQELDRAHDDLKNLTSRRTVREETHGTDEVRRANLENLARDRAAAEEKLAAFRAALDALQPDLLEADEERLARAVAVARERLHEAGIQHAVAQNTLRTDGNADPVETLALAAASLESAERQHAAIERRARALRLVTDTFASERRALAHQFTQPLADKVTDYLRQIFGPGAAAAVELTDGTFEQLALSRNGQAFAFASLSGGTREQVAAAFRLAMAEVLAADHGGCLPVVFDDAFTHSDPDRIQSLQRMLDLAARRGLQVILLTCSPRDYSALGAKTVATHPQLAAGA